MRGGLAGAALLRGHTFGRGGRIVGSLRTRRTRPSHGAEAGSGAQWRIAADAARGTGTGLLALLTFGLQAPGVLFGFDLALGFVEHQLALAQP